MTPPTLAQRFAITIQGLCDLIASLAGQNHALIPLVLRVHPRLRRFAQRFARLLAAWHAGTLRPPRKRDAKRKPAKPEPALPTRNAWLSAAMRPAAQYGGPLDTLMRDPETLALIAAEPARAGRLLRPVCRMFGLVYPGPKPVSRRAPRPPKPPAKPRPRLDSPFEMPAKWRLKIPSRRFSTA